MCESKFWKLLEGLCVYHPAHVNGSLEIVDEWFTIEAGLYEIVYSSKLFLDVVLDDIL